MAVFKELQQTGDHQLRFWCDKRFGPSAKGIFAAFDPDIPVEFIQSGKLRRYHGKGVRFHLQPSILFPNIRDLFLVGLGLVQFSCAVYR